jgi:hypothetical protein
MEADPTQVKDITARIRAFRESGPKGLPENRANTTATDHEYPLNNVLPKDKGWNPKTMVQGNGYGPAIGSEESVSQ